METVDQDFITIVSGLPRSGTSMMMRMLEKGGLPILTDSIRAADDDNPHGYYEFEPVKRLEKDSSWLPTAYNKAVKVIYIFLYHLPRNNRYKVLFVRRELEEVVASQKVMLDRREQVGRLSERQLIDSYQDHLQKLDQWIRRQDNIAVHYLDHAEVLHQPRQTALDVSRFLGLPLDIEAMARSVDPSLHRNRSQHA